jgi:hypothetical protein
MGRSWGFFAPTASVSRFALCRVSGIDVLWRLLLPLRRHPRRIGGARHTARSELLSLNIVFRLLGLDAIGLAISGHG